MRMEVRKVMNAKEVEMYWIRNSQKEHLERQVVDKVIKWSQQGMNGLYGKKDTIWSA
jgi:hypothetical protein